MIDVLRKTKLIIAGLTLCFFAGGCSFLVTCEDTIQDEVRSPRDNYAAVLSIRNCGATTDYSSRVTVSGSGTSSREEDVVFVVKGEPEIRVTWQEDTVLQISCEGCKAEDVFKQANGWRQVSIHY